MENTLKLHSENNRFYTAHDLSPSIFGEKHLWRHLPLSVSCFPAQKISLVVKYVDWLQLKGIRFL
jgi:hypothetical protein